VTDRQEEIRKATSRLLDAIHALDLALNSFYQSVCEGKERTYKARFSSVSGRALEAAEAIDEWERELVGLGVIERSS